jgi:hypothetical protein
VEKYDGHMATHRAPRFQRIRIGIRICLSWNDELGSRHSPNRGNCLLAHNRRHGDDWPAGHLRRGVPGGVSGCPHRRILLGSCIHRNCRDLQSFCSGHVVSYRSFWTVLLVCVNSLAGSGCVEVWTSPPSAALSGRPAQSGARLQATRSEFMKFLRRIFQFAFGSCHHGQMSRVFTIRKRTYQVCFECGQEFDCEAS